MVSSMRTAKIFAGIWLRMGGACGGGDCGIEAGIGKIERDGR
jgi:hypothetical protein